MTVPQARPDHRSARLEAYLAAYTERWGRAPADVPEFVPDPLEAPVPTLTVPVAVPAREVMGANDRPGHWAVRSRVTQRLRDRGRLAHRMAGSPRMVSATCHVAVIYPDRRKRDVANLYPTVKAILDGMVAAGLLPDDDDAHLRGPWLEHDPEAVPTALDVAVNHVPAAARPFLFLFAFTTPDAP